MAGAERTRDSLGKERHWQERECLHQGDARERQIADGMQRQTESRGRDDSSRERKTKAKLRGKEIGRQRALLHREERERQEKEREREGEKERARKQQRAGVRADGFQHARDRTREPRESAGRSGDESTTATTDGNGKNFRRRSSGSGGGGEVDINGESREARGGRREARDKRKRAVRGEAEDSTEPPQLRGIRRDDDGDSDFDGSPTVRGKFALRRRRSGHEDCETRGSDRAREKTRSSSRKNERKERRWRKSRDHKEITVAGRKSSGNRIIVGDGDRWQPSPSPTAIESRAPASASNALERRSSPNQMPFSAWEPNRRTGNSHQRRSTQVPQSLFPSRPFQRRGATRMLSSPLRTSRGMGSGTLDLGGSAGVARGARGGMGSLSNL